jgi:hypothetical protein
MLLRKALFKTRLMSKSLAILSYPNSNNLGDFIQSLAAKQVLNKMKTFEIDRDELQAYKGEKVALIMNGWFMEKSKNWPPSEQIDPLFLSFHLNPTAEKGMLSKKGISYFKRHEPIGCRDHYTRKLLISFGIEAYYSACLTLTLKRDNFISKNSKREGIFVISPLERLNPKSELVPKGFLRQTVQQIKKPIKQKQFETAIKRLERFLQNQTEKTHHLTQLIDTKDFNEKERIEKAKLQLKNIARAKLVITSRIHTALPAVAFGTPVLFLSDGLDHPNQKSRLDGMEQFFPIINSKDLRDWETKFPKPYKTHLPFVKNFEKQINRFLKE